MPLVAGMRLGPYEISAPIGAGGMGEVYRARDSRLNREIALKILPLAFANDADRLRRFQLEAQAAGSLNHPNIVAVYDIGQSDGAAYVVTELLEGETLRHRMASSSIPPRKAVEYAVQAARGLAAAHAKGITHRDIKPDNLFLTREGFLKILDFGLAKVTATVSSEQTSAPTAPLDTGAGVVLGTAGYMAPEQVRAAPTDQRVDLFALGVVLYEMLSGRRAFTGASSVETMNAILKEDPPDLPATVPAPLAAIVRRCMEKNADERFGSARDLAYALESVSTASSRETPVIATLARRRPTMATGAAGIVALLLIAVAWTLGRRSSTVSLPQVQQLTFRRGSISSARFSSDGKTILYTAAWDGKPAELFSTSDSGPESRPLGISNAHISAVSRNGEMALTLTSAPYLWATPPSGTLARAPIAGGAPREIANDVVQADWSPDGSQLAIVRAVPGGQVLEYPIGKKLYETAGGIFGLRISPDGEFVAFQDCQAGWDFSGHITVVGRDGTRRAVGPRFWGVLGLAWAAGGKEIIFSGIDRGITTSLKALDLKGSVRTIAPLPGAFVLLDLTADGRALVMHDSFTAGMLFHRAGSNGEVDLYWHDNSVIRDISPAGTQILFSEGGNASKTDWASFMRATSGTPAVFLGEGFGDAFSPDERFAMLTPSASGQLVALPTRAGSPQTLTSGTLRYAGGRWSPDGKRLVTVASAAGHRARFYVQELGKGDPKPISGEDLDYDRGDDIVISPDSAAVAAGISEREIQLLELNGSAARPVPGSKNMTPVAWCSDGTLLAYHRGEIPAHIMRIDIGSGGQRPWKDLGPSDRTALTMVGPIRVLSDCETYGYTTQHDPTTLWLLTGIR